MRKITICLALLIICSCFTDIALGQVLSGENSDQITIDTNNFNAITRSPIQISGAPSNAYVTNINFQLNIDHDDVSEVRFWVGTNSWSSEDIDAFKTGDDFWDGYNETHEDSYSYTLDINDNQSPNQIWYLVAQDPISGNIGRIDGWSIEVSYAIPKPPELSLSGFDETIKTETNEFTWNVSYVGEEINGNVCNDGDISMQWGIGTAGEDFWFDVNPSSGAVPGRECRNVSISVEENPSTTSSRKSSVSFYDINNTNNFVSIIIDQDRAPKPAKLTLINTPNNPWNVNSAGEARTFEFKNDGELDLNWSIQKSSSADWVSIADDSGILQEGELESVQITVFSNNNNSDRQVDLKFYNGSDHVYTHTIDQVRTPTSDLRTTFKADYSNINYEGKTITGRVYNDGGGTLNWEALTNDNWITSSPQSGEVESDNYQEVILTIDKNVENSERSGRISFFNDDNNDINETESVDINQNGAPITNSPPIANAIDISGQPTELYPNGLYSVSAVYTDPDGREDLKSAQLRLAHSDGSGQQDIVLNWNRVGNEFYPWESGDGNNYVDRLLSVDVEQVTNGYKLTWNFVIKPQWPETSSGIRYGVRALDMSDTETNPVWDYDGSNTSFQNPTGVTVLVHGLNLTGDSDKWYFPDDFLPNNYWLDGAFVKALLEAYGGGIVYHYLPETGEIIEFENSEFSQYYNTNGEKIILHNWAKTSNNNESGQVEAAAESFFAALINGGFVNPGAVNNPSFHFISHSRGTSVSSEIIQRLNYHNLDVSYQTNLDVHDFDEDLVPFDQNFHDPSVQIWDNVNYADNFWQIAYHGVPYGYVVPSGRPLNQLIDRYPFEVELTDALGFGSDDTGGVLGGNTHGLVINWYMGTINPGSEEPSWYKDEKGFDAGFSRWRRYGGHSFDQNFEGFSTLNPLASTDPLENIIKFSNNSTNYYLGEDTASELLFNGNFDTPNLDKQQPAGWSLHGGGGEGFVSNSELFLGYDNLYRDFPFLSKTHNRFYIPENAAQIFFEYNIKIHDNRDDSNADRLQVLISDEIVIDNILLNNESIKAGGLPIDFERIFNERGREFRGTVNTLTFRVDSPSGSTRSVIAIDDIRMVLDKEDSPNTKPNEPIARLPLEDEFIKTLTPTFVWSEFIHGGDGDSQAGYQIRVRESETAEEKIVYDTGFISSVSANTHVYSPGAFSGTDPETGTTRISEPLENGKKYHWHVRYRDSGGDWSAWSADGAGNLQHFTVVINKNPTISILNGPVNGSTITIQNPTIIWSGSVPDGNVANYEVDLQGPSPVSFTTTDTTHQFSSLSDGGYLFRVRAIDDQGLASSWAERSFGIVTDGSSNNPPVVSNSITDQSAVVNESFGINIPANTFSDPDGDPLTLTAKLADGSDLPSWLVFTINQDGSATFSGISPAVDNLEIRVTATDPGGLSASDTFTLIITDESNTAPGVSIVSGPSEGSTINISNPEFGWSGSDPDGSVTNYEVELQGPSPESFITSETTHQFTGLVKGSYLFRVRAIDDQVLASSWADRSFEVVLDNVALATPEPTGPEQTIPQNTSVLLDWKSVDGASSYNVQLATDQEFNSILLDTSGVISDDLKVEGLDFETLYYWRVSATDGTEVSEWSETWFFSTITSTSKPALTTLLSPADGETDTDTSVVLKWLEIEGAQGYVLRVAGDNAYSDIIVEDGSLQKAEFQLDSLEHSKTYYWSVKVYNQNGITDWTDSFNFTTRAEIANQPPTVSIVNGPQDGSTIDFPDPGFVWSGSDPDGSVANYEVEMQGASPESFTTSDSTHLFSDLSNGSYLFRVRAIDDRGLSSSWAERSFEVNVSTSPLTFTGTLQDQTLRAGDDRNQSSEVYTLDDIPALFEGGAAPVSYSVQSENPDKVEAQLSGQTLTVTGIASGTEADTVTVTLTATDDNGDSASGSFKVNTLPPYGDISGDERVNSLDASQILQHVVELITLNQHRQSVADLDQKGSINSFDASLVLQYSVELIDQLPTGTNFNVATSQAKAAVPENRVSWGEMSYAEDGTIQIPLVVEQTGNATSFDFTGTLSSADYQAKVELTGIPDDWMVVKRTGEDGSIKLALAGVSPLKAGTIATLLLEPVGAGIAEPVTLSGQGFVNAEAYMLGEVRAKELPEKFVLENNYPNPFNPSTNIQYQLPAAAEVRIEIYNITGRLIQKVVDKRQNAGTYTQRIDMSAFSSGIYIIRMRAKSDDQSFTKTSKMTLIK